MIESPSVQTLPSALTTPREPRFSVVPAREVHALVHRHGPDGEETISAKLVNLSRGGAKLVLPQPLPFAEIVEIEVRIDDTEISIDGAARVCWTRPADASHWQIGCAFETRLCESVLDHLAASSYLDRREHDRDEVTVSGTARSELSRSPFPVRLRDYSLGGFSIVCPRPLEVGVQVRLEVAAGSQEQVPFTGRVQWQVQEEDTYLVGCSFLDAKGPRSLLDALAEAEREQRIKNEKRIREQRAKAIESTQRDVLPEDLDTGQLIQLGAATFLLTASAVVIAGLLL